MPHLILYGPSGTGKTSAITEKVPEAHHIDLTKDPKKGLSHIHYRAAVKKSTVKLKDMQLSKTAVRDTVPNKVHKLRKCAKALEEPNTTHPIPPEAYTLTPETYADLCDKLNFKFNVDLNGIKVSNIPDFISATRCTHLQEALRCNLHEKCALIYTTRDRASMLLQYYNSIRNSKTRSVKGVCLVPACDLAKLREDLQGWELALTLHRKQYTVTKHYNNRPSRTVT
jgi:DNA polymerase III delta prime subunit